MAAEKKLTPSHRGPDVAGAPHLSIEEKYDEVRQLINIGKEKGYLLYDEVNELLPSEITSSDELDDLFDAFWLGRGMRRVQQISGAPSEGRTNWKLPVCIWR